MPSTDADRNLLFGILALQMDFLKRDELIAGMNAWVLEKHRPLGEILVERGCLNSSLLEALDRMVDLHVARHGDPRASLEALSSASVTADSLQRSVVDPELQQSISAIGAGSTGAANSLEGFDTVDFHPSGVRFRKVRDHARGGLGVVFVARDEELHREVALKEIQDRHADDPASRARFLMEAEITGGLEHPGIVPVYGLGHYDNGRPFYAMRFIKGNSLKEAIGRFHADQSLKHDPGQRLLALQKLLRRFLDVCNAVAYAHSRGVLHRDLKPDNVMVGKYGETLVVDWGLAKALGHSGSEAEGLAAGSMMLSPSSGSAETLPGSVVGTPGYMSPEQASGRLDLLGPRSDVYSLGATLHALLTGRVPFVGDDQGEVLRKVRLGEFARPRELAPWLDPALEAICVKAMALRPEDRYTSPQALAEDLERVLADEPITAYPEPFTRRTRRWARKHRIALATLGSAATVALILFGATTWARVATRQKTDTSALAILRQAEALAIEARTSGDLARWEKAIAEALRASERLESAGGSPQLLADAKARLETLRIERNERREFLETEKKDRRLVDALQEARLIWRTPDETLDLQREKCEAYQAALRDYGIDVENLSVEEAAKRVRSSKATDEILVALDSWTTDESSKERSSRLEAITRAAETDPGRAVIRDLVAHKDTAGLRKLCENEQDRRKLGPRLRSIFDALRYLDPSGSYPIFEAIRRENPGDFRFNHDLGMIYCEAKPPLLPEALRYMLVAVALRPESLATHNNLGKVFALLGDYDAAIIEFRSALRIDPRMVGVHFNLGRALNHSGEREAGIEELRTAIRLRPDHAMSHFALGGILAEKGDHDGAIAEYREAIRIQPDSLEARNNLGASLAQQGDLEGAIEQFRAASRINPKDALSHYNLGNGLMVKDEIDAAVTEYREAIQLNPDYAEAHDNLGTAFYRKKAYREAIEEFRVSLRIRPESASTHANLGNALTMIKDFDQAAEEYRASLRIDPLYPRAHYNLGKALAGKNDIEGALEEFREAIRIEPRFDSVHLDLGDVLKQKGNLDGAIAEYKAALEINPRFAVARNNLGTALQLKGDIDGAITAYKAALEINPESAPAHLNLGSLLVRKGDPDGAIAEFRIAARLEPGASRGHFSLANALKRKGELDEAIEEYRAALRIDPNLALAHCFLGTTLQTQGQLTEALEHLQKGHELGSKLPNWRNPSAQWIEDCRKMIELEQKIPAMLRGELKPTDEPERMKLAEFCFKKRLYAASARFYGEAFAGRPALFEEIRIRHGLDAARAAILAGVGQGNDDPKPDEATRAKLREQGLGWLKADLANLTRVFESGDEAGREQAVERALIRSKTDANLAEIRDEASLAKWPEEERAKFQAYWSEVNALLKKAQAH